MNRQDYRAAFDAVDFSPDFEERTLQKLAAMRQASEKEQNKMSMNRMKKVALLAAAAVALLAVTVSAAVAWLTENGVLRGNSQGDLMLDQPLTRRQFAVLEYRIARLEGFV